MEGTGSRPSQEVDKHISSANNHMRTIFVAGENVTCGILLKDSTVISELGGKLNEKGPREGMTKETWGHYNLNFFGTFNTLSSGRTATTSFSSAFPLPLIIITTVVLALLVDARNNLLDKDRCLLSNLLPSFVAPGVSSRAGCGTGSIAVANGTPESRLGIGRRLGRRTEFSRRFVDARLLWEPTRRKENPGLVLV